MAGGGPPGSASVLHTHGAWEEKDNIELLCWQQLAVNSHTSMPILGIQLSHARPQQLSHASPTRDSRTRRLRGNEGHSIFYQDPELHKTLSLRIFKAGRVCCPLWAAQELRVEGTCEALLGLRLVPKSRAPEHPPSLLLPQSLPGILRLHRDVDVTQE